MDLLLPPGFFGIPLQRRDISALPIMPACHAVLLGIPRLERRVGGTHQGLSQVVDAVQDVAFAMALVACPVSHLTRAVLGRQDCIQLFVERSLRAVLSARITIASEEYAPGNAADGTARRLSSHLERLGHAQYHCRLRRLMLVDETVLRTREHTRRVQSIPCRLGARVFRIADEGVIEPEVRTNRAERALSIRFSRARSSQKIYCTYQEAHDSAGQQLRKMPTRIGL